VTASEPREAGPADLAEVHGFGMRTAAAGGEATDLTLDTIDPLDAMRAAYLGPDWVGPVLIAVLFAAAVVAIVILSGGTHWQVG
jgi:hypothetical protein